MMKKILSAALALAMAISVFPQMIASAADAAVDEVVTLDPSNASPFNGGSFEGWGTSMGWWGNRIGYSDTLAQKSAELFYSEEGLGLDIVRYNVGGGDDPTHTHVTRSDSKMPCFAVPEYNEDGTLKTDESGSVVYNYNWEADHNQVNVLARIKEQNDNVHIEGYTNSPPWFMTNSKCSGGGINAGENLAPENYGAFASFLGDVTDHFEEIGLKFDSYSPMNEPNPATKYWGYQSVKQEGNHVAPGANQSGLITALSNEYDKRGIDTMVVGLDETSIDYSITSFNSLTAEAKTALDRLDTHTYSGSKRAQLKQTAIDGGKNLWMSEVDHGGTAGTNAGNMGMALDLANMILRDMNGMQPAAWVMWDILDFHKDSEFTAPNGTKTEANNALNQNGGLWGIGMVNHDTQEIELTQKYYGYGQFTKYINPGDTIIASSDSTLAAYNKHTGAVKVVAVNTTGSEKNYMFDMSAFSQVGEKAQIIRTSGAIDGGEHWADLGSVAVTDKKFSYALPANSITTFVVDNKDAVLDKFEATGEKLSYSYSVAEELRECNKYFAVYDNNNALRYLSVNKPSETIEGDFTGCKAKLYVWDKMNPKITPVDTVNNDTLSYITISGEDMVIAGQTYTYTSVTSDSSAVTWSVSDASIASIDAKTGVLTPLKGGNVTVTASSASVGSNSISVLISDAPKIEVAASNVTGTASWNNVEATSVKTVVDGNLDTYFDGLRAGYAILDLGTKYDITMIGYAPRAGYEYRMIDGSFYVSNDMQNWTEAYKVTSQPASEKITYVMGSDLKFKKGTYRYVKYAVPDGTQSYNGKSEDYNCNIAEIEVYGKEDESAANITITGADSVERKSTAQYSAVITGAQAKDIKWSVSDESIALIDENGLLTAVGTGTVTVYAKSEALGITAVKNVTVTWAKLVPEAVSGSEPWNNDASNGPAKAVDGNQSTFFDGMSGGYVLLDFGKAYNIERLGFAPRSKLESRMRGVSFMASLDGINWKTIYSISSTPSSGMHYINKDGLQNVTDNAYRYVKCQGTDYCNIAEIEVYGEAAPLTNSEKLAQAAAKVNIPETVYGNLNMPAAVDEASVVWTSSNTAVIKNDGIVTRGNEDTPVTLSAVFTLGAETLTKTYNVTVKEAATGKTEADMAAYLFVHFVGTEGTADDEQVYFSVSKDGTTWETLNEGYPILKSTVGEGGVRDPHIVRSPEGDKFFLIATDLSIYGRRGDSNRWGTCQTSGSKSIVVWESTDLVNWSEASLVKVAPDNAGCTWAPESIYDSEKGMYMVFWASKVATDNYGMQRIYRSYTRDFKSFTEPEVYIEDTVSNIDTTFIKDNGIYYRFTKNESKSSIIMEKSATLDGPFEAVSTYTINGIAGNTVTGYEGPTAYKINGENKWCLLLDYYSKSQGYKPFMTSDISKGVFTSGSDFSFDTKYRHGSVMPITQEEYDALIKKYPIVPEAEMGEVIFSLDFDNEDASQPALGTAAVNGEITYENGYKGKAAKLDGTDYIEIKAADGTSLLTGLDTFTVSFMSKASAQSWWFYTAPNTNSQTYKSEKYVGVLDSTAKLTCERYNSDNQERPSSAATDYTNGAWKHVTVVHNKKSYTLYVDGVKKSTVSTGVDLKTLLGDNSVAYIGKANWGNGEYSAGLIDEFKVYNYAMSEQAVADEYAALTK